MVGLDRTARQRVLTLLEALPDLDTVERRTTALLPGLPLRLTSQIARSNIKAVDLANIFDTCAGWTPESDSGDPPPLALVLDNVRALTKGSLALQLQEVLISLPPEWQIVVPRPECPYPGMVAFQTADGHLFCGREPEIEQLVLRLRNQGFLLVIGPSGSGKSSLIFAGLIPGIQAIPSAYSYWPSGYWHVISLAHPGPQPAAALEQLLGGSIAQPATTVAAYLAEHEPATRLLLVIDQGEEMFTQADIGEQRRFITALTALQTLDSCTVLLAMRADFYADLMTSDLWPRVEGARQEIVPLRGEGLRAAIRQPAASVGVEVEDGLVELLLADAAGQPGSLPLLQETLVLLWDKMQGHILPLRAYLNLGRDGQSGLAVALEIKADATWAALSVAQREIARRIFLRLIQYTEGRPPTRRQQPEMSLLAAGDDPALFEKTLRALTDNRLLTTSAEVGGSRVVDLAHEALIAGWPMLRRWVIERREAELSRRRLEERAVEWVRQGRGKGALLDESSLLEAEHWLASPDAQELGYSEDLVLLTRASRAAVEAAMREKRMARYLRVAVVLLFGALSAIALILFVPPELARQQAGAVVPLPVPTLNVAFEPDTVTNRRYALCVQARPPCERPDIQASTFYTGETQDLPVTGVDAFQAWNFCHWIGRRLPSLEEWAYVATEGHQKAWPWGDASPDPTRTNLCYACVMTPRQPTPSAPERIGQHPAGAAYGINDLIGNVWEWTITPSPAGAPWDGQAKNAPKRLTVVGGSYLTDAPPPNSNDRKLFNAEKEVSAADVTNRAQMIGFRCVAGGTVQPMTTP